MSGELMDTDLAQMANSFRDGNNNAEVAPAPVPMAEDSGPLGAAPDSEEREVSWADDSQDLMEDTSVSTPAPSEAPPQTIKFKADGEDKELSLEEVRKELSLRFGARQAIQEKSKIAKEAEGLRKQLKEADQYKAKWDELEAVKHDRKKVLEMLTGQPYDEFIKQEIQRHEIHQYGTEEQKQLLDYSERFHQLDQERKLETSKRENQLKRTQEARDAAEQTQFNNTLEREYRKQLEQMPKDLDPSRVTRYKNMLWNQAKAELADYLKQYGKITNKMVEKAFTDNASALFQGTNELVDKKLSQALDSHKKSAKEQAQLASVKQSKPLANPAIAKMSSNQYIDYLNSKKR